MQKMGRVTAMHNLVIDQNEVLRYLGCSRQWLDSSLGKLIAQCIDEAKTLIQPRMVYKFFNLDRAAGELLLRGTSVKLPGGGIADHMAEAEACIVMAVTLGLAVDRKISCYEKVDLTRAVILDACASAAVEQSADSLCAEIEAKLKLENKQLTTRFSPGYADFPLTIQRQLLALLNAERTIGLTVTSHNILLPRKSITAVAGVIGLRQSKGETICADCSQFGDCQFRKERKTNGR